MKCPIILAADANYAMPLATTLRSIVETNQRHWPVEFYLFYDGFTPEVTSAVTDSLPPGSAVLHWMPVESKLFEGFSNGPKLNASGKTEISHVSKMAYARLLIPRLVPETVARVLYLDVDLLVLEDLRPLFEIDLGEAVIGAVLDFHLHNAYLAQGFDPALKRSLHPNYRGLPPVRDYFNSGVLLIDLARWRKEEISEKAFAYLERFPFAPHMDQDALNTVLDKRWKELAPHWNVQDHYRRINGRQGILHFVTKAKPWLASSRSANAALYDRFRSQTSFQRTRREKLRDAFIRFGTGIKNVLKRRGFSSHRKTPAPTASTAAATSPKA